MKNKNLNFIHDILVIICAITLGFMLAWGV